MKKIIALMLSLLMLFSVAACVKSAGKAGENVSGAPAATESKGTTVKTESPTEEPTTEPTEEPTPEPTEEPTSEPTEEPTPEPTETPEPAEVPAEVKINDAFARMKDLESFRIDVNVQIDMNVEISMDGTSLKMPMHINAKYLTDKQKEPLMTRGTMEMSVDLGAFGKENMNTLIYTDSSGKSTVTYTSFDDGETWTADSETAPVDEPYKTFDVLQYSEKFEKVGHDEMDGRPVTVYTSQLTGQYMQDALNAAGMDELMSFFTDPDQEQEDSDQEQENVLKEDIILTIYIDDESGYLVFYSMDMTDLFRELITALLLESMDLPEEEGVEVKVEVSVAKGETALSQFDSIEPIVIPAAALAAMNEYI